METTSCRYENMIRYLKNDEINKQSWDACIQKAFNGNIYAYSWYLDAVAYGWEALVDGEYETVFPLPVRRKFGIAYLYQPLFVQQLGIFSISKLNPRIVQNFFETLPSQIKYGRIQLNYHNKLESTPTLNVQYKPNIELALTQSIEQIRKHYSENTRRNIRKAQNSNLTVIENQPPDFIVKMFRENHVKHNIAWSDGDYKKLTHLLYLLIHKGYGLTRGVFDRNNSWLGGAFFAFSHQRVILLLSAVTEGGRQTGAMHFLIDDTISRYMENVLIFDFEGSTDPNLARFYNSFGSATYYYPLVELNRLPHLISKLYKKLRKLD